GCATTTNSDPNLKGQPIWNTATFFKMCSWIETSLESLPQDFGYYPDRVENKPHIYVSVLGIDLDDHTEFMDDDKRPGGSNEVKPKHPAMNVQLGEGQRRPTILENAFIYLDSRWQYELNLLPFAGFQTEFMLYLNLAIANGESFNICCRTTFEGSVPMSYKDFVKGQDPRHYYHRMMLKLAKLLDGTRATVVVQSAKTLRMMYNTCGWFPKDAEDKTGRYR
ncbi:MAG: hypothetical protein GY847_06570, partial [Proteobacteria bacterium]|nr:hypothetical protein [Pseudomonadota bacterium]